MSMNKKTIAVVGLGYVGLPLALLAEKKGYKVIGIDKDSEKVALINKSISPYKDAEIQKQLKKSRIEATDDFSKITKASIIVICVPTPVYGNNMPNLEPVAGASKNISEHLRKGHLVILESTVNPGISENVVLPLLKDSGLISEKDFFLAHCPERINPGDKKWNVENINRVVGALSPVGLKKAVDFYKSIITGEVKPMNAIKEAEAVKVVENTFRDINIAFANELAMSFSRLGIDVVNVIEGAATKPFAFMPHYPGCGVGGHCIPVDPYYLIEYAKENGFNHDFLALARRINSHMPEFAATQAVNGLNEKGVPIVGRKVAVLGLAYKPEIDDCRESPSFEIIDHLKQAGLEVTSYDPFVPSRSTAESLDQALDGADVALIATGHSAFTKLPPEYFLDKGIKVVVDGRNCLPKSKFVKAGIIYKGIGK